MMSDIGVHIGLEGKQWAHYETGLCLRLPAPFAALAASLPHIPGIVTTCELGSSRVELAGKHTMPIGWDSRRGGRRTIGGGINDAWMLKASFPPLRFPRLDSTVRRLLDVGKEVVDNVRNALAPLIAERGNGDQLEDTHHAISSLQMLVDDIEQFDIDCGIEGTLMNNEKYPIMKLLEAFHACGVLKNDTKFKAAAAAALRAALPKQISGPFLRRLLHQDNRMPSATTISRLRGRVDVALMILTRKLLQSTIDTGDGGFVLYPMVDSSPQGGRDYEMVCLQIVFRVHLARLHEDIRQLERRRLMSRAERVRSWNVEEELMNAIRDRILKMTAPLVQLGRTSLAMKFQATMHSLFLLSSSCDMLSFMVSSVPGWISDYGTERHFSYVEPIEMHHVFPWVSPSETPEPPPELQVEEVDFASSPVAPATPTVMYQEPDFADAFDDPPDLIDMDRDTDDAQGQARAPLVPRRLLDLTSSLEIPGLLHIIHNAGRTLEKSMTHYADATYRLGKLSAILSSRETRERLEETCFADEVGQALWTHLRGFSARCYPERWGTVAKTLVDLTPSAIASLQARWDIKKYMAGVKNKRRNIEALSPQCANDADHEDHVVKIEVIDESLASPFWTSYWRMLGHVSEVLLKCLAWAEGCPCHHDLLRESIEEGDPLVPSMKAAALRCPLRGKRCAELAEGDFMEVVRTIYDECNAQVAQSIPNILDEKEKLAICQDLEASKIGLLTEFALKTAHWDKEEFGIFGLAHYDDAKVWRRYQRIMQSSSTHPRVKRLKAELLSGERAAFEDAAGFGNAVGIDGLRSFAAELRLQQSVERAVEAEHAATRREVGRCPNHSEALVSLMHREDQVAYWLGDDSERFKEFADIVADISHGRRACELLGLGAHPVSERYASRPRHNAHWKVIYHADAWTKWSMPQPLVRTREPVHSALGCALPADPGGADPVKRHFIIEHVLDFMRSNHEYFFSMEMEEGTFQTLQARLEPHDAAAGAGKLQMMGDELGFNGRIDGASRGAIVGGARADTSDGKMLVFFKVVKDNLARAVRTKVDGQMGLQGVKAVSVHRPLQFFFGSPKILVSLRPMNVEVGGLCGEIPITMHPNQFSVHALMRMAMWKPDLPESVTYQFNEHTMQQWKYDYASGSNKNLIDELPYVLRLLMTAPAGVPDSALDRPEHQAILDGMGCDGLVQGPPWRLTTKGTHNIECGIVLAAPQLALKPLTPEDDLMSASRAELLLEMESRGWEHVPGVDKRHARRVRATPYDPKQPDKKWYTKAEEVPSRFYLLALLKASEEKVPHLQKVAVYRQLLGLEDEERPAKRRRTHAQTVLPELDWPEDCIVQLKRRPVARPRKPVAHGPEECDSVSNPDSDDLFGAASEEKEEEEEEEEKEKEKLEENLTTTTLTVGKKKRKQKK